MSPKHSSVRGVAAAAPASKGERYLMLLVEGAAINVPEVDEPSYRAFRESVTSLARQMPDRLSETDMLPIIKSIVHEFELYRHGADGALRERQMAWRTLTNRLMRELLAAFSIDAGSATAAPLMQKVSGLSTSEHILGFRAELDAFLHPDGRDLVPRSARLKTADRSKANDNASGLRGGGAAEDHLREILSRGGLGFVVLFRLSCLDMIGDRFGMDAMHDSMMAIAAFLTQSLRGKDAVYHWSESSLLAILECEATEQMLTSAMQRIVNSNRDITIQIENRNVMLRVPLTFEMTPFTRFTSGEDLLKLGRGPTSKV